MRTSMIAILLGSAVMMGALAQGVSPRPDEPAWLIAWVRACEAVPGCAVEWHTGVPSQDAAGVPVGVMRFRHTILYRWPDCLRRDEEYLGGGPETPGAQQHGMALLFDRSVVITPDAQRWQIRATQKDAPELGVPLDSHYMMAREIPSAPWLLGRWIAEHPDGYHFEAIADDGVRVSVAELRVMADLSRDGELAVVHSIEEFQNGVVVLRYEYDDFKSIPGWPGRMGHVRTVFTPGANGGLEPVNADSLINARVEPNLDDTEFEPARARMAKRLPGLLIQAQRETPVMPLEPAHAGDMLGAINGGAAAQTSGSRWWPWAAGAAVAMVFLGMWTVLRRKTMRS